MNETEIRYKIEQHRLTFRHRITIWWADVSFALSDLWDALKSWPEHYTRYVDVKPGEPGYDDAERYWLDSHPARYDFKDGEWVRREEEQP